MTLTFLHGCEVLRIDTGARPIQTVRSSVIGLIGTAPQADAALWPLNTPRLVSRRTEMVGLGSAGTLQSALDQIWDQAGAVVIVVRVAEGADEDATIVNIIGGINNSTGAYEGVHCFVAARSLLGHTPRLLCAPGFTHQRSSDGILSAFTISGTNHEEGAGYRTAPPVTITHATGQHAEIRAVLGNGANAGKVMSLIVDDPGVDYSGAAPAITIGVPPTGIASVSMSAGAGVNKGLGYLTPPAVTITHPTGTGAVLRAVLGTGADATKVDSIVVDDPGDLYSLTDLVVQIASPPPGGTQAVAGTKVIEAGTRAVVGTINVGATRSRVVAEMLGIAERLRATVLVDGPNTTDDAAVQIAEDWGSSRIFVTDPWVLRNGESLPSSPAIAGLINKVDNEKGFWWSPSNHEINGIEGTSRAIDFELGDYFSRANLLNELKIATIIRDDGYRLWGNRTLSTDPKYAFLSVARTADMVADSILYGHRWAVDRCISAVLLEEVQESVRGYLRLLQSREAILGGDCWIDLDLNLPEVVAGGHIIFDFDITPPPPAERITFRSHLVDDYIINIFNT